MDYAHPAQEVLEKNISKWPTDYSCDILTKNMVAFHLVLKICQKLNSRAMDELHWQRGVQKVLVLTFMRSLAITLTENYNKKHIGQRYLQNVHFEEKKVNQKM